MALPVQLRVATPWSFHWGASHLDDLAARAVERGIRTLGMADLNGLWGAVPFQTACLKHGLQPVFGARLCVEGIELQAIAVDAEGWAGLCRLLTRLQFSGLAQGLNKSGLGRSRRLLDWLAAESASGLALLTHDEQLLQELRAVRGSADLYVRVRPRDGGGADAAVAKRLGLPCVAAPTVAFADRADYARHRLLVAIGANTSLSRLEESPAAQSMASPSAWLQDAEHLQLAYRYAPEALTGAAALAEACVWRIPIGVSRKPRFPVPHGRSAAAHLARLCERGRRRRRLQWDPRYGSQLQRELSLINEQGMADYFLIVADIVRWSRQQQIQSCGRGSAANSLVSYLLGLTHVDPVRQDLWFDRFMNQGRSDFPDVDLDFAWDERDRVLDYVYQRYGRERVAMISTHQTFAARGAVRELAKVLGVPAAEIGLITRALPWHRSGGLDLEQLRKNPKTAQLPLDAEPWRTILQQAAGLDGLPRHLGVHAGGIVLAPTPLTDHLPLQLAKKTTEHGALVITQWDMDPIEDAGLLKIDLLGNRGLAVIRDGAREVRKNTGLQLDFARIDPQRDARTRELIERGDTMGCFYVESPSMRSLLQKLRCRDFSTLVAASSIIRPGISQSGMMRAYIERFHYVLQHREHRKDWYLAPQLRELLAETYGVMTYQEDVLKVAQKLAGMSAADADGLRRAMSKKRAYQRLEAWKQQFIKGVQQVRSDGPGLNVEAAHELWRQIESFSGYSFCKAHSASFAEVSFRSAYLRAHHPAEFMAAVLRNYGGYYSTFAYLAEARRMGLELQLPCVNRSGRSFESRGDGVQVGLSQIQGLSDATLERILSARRGQGRFRALQELVDRVQPLPKELDSLVRSGACDGLPDLDKRADRMRWAALYARRRTSAVARPSAHSAKFLPAAGQGGGLQRGLFALGSIPKPPAATEFCRERLLELEAEALGFLVSDHPLCLHRKRIRAAGAVPASQLREHLNRRVRLVGWQVTQKPITTRAGKAMMFLSFEDTTALYEAVLFPHAYKRLAPWTLTRGPYLVEGIPREEHGAITVEVQQLRLLHDPSADNR
jgi:DNA-directed DNA polymerase III PolC